MADLTKVHQALQSLGSTTGVHDLRARANGDAIEIHGTVRSIAEKQDIMRSLTQQVGDMGLVNLLQVQREQQAQPHINPGLPNMTSASSGIAPGVTHSVEKRTHTVKKGETLSHIAQHYYGKAGEYKKIFEANRNQLSDPDKIREGMTLQIP
ncbi:MAG TPA: LysM peptidoglycan-binding domain-containing protein [Thermoanaerobaculia bacterium]|jgi:nucleoid-associated protein YgaU